MNPLQSHLLLQYKTGEYFVHLWTFSSVSFLCGWNEIDTVCCARCYCHTYRTCRITATRYSLLGRCLMVCLFECGASNYVNVEWRREYIASFAPRDQPHITHTQAIWDFAIVRLKITTKPLAVAHCESIITSYLTQLLINFINFASSKFTLCLCGNKRLTFKRTIFNQSNCIVTTAIIHYIHYQFYHNVFVYR